MTERQELLDATDEVIEDAVRFADPMILRGLLYQLTGDASVAATEVHGRVLGLAEAMVLANASDAELLQSKAADFLKSYRDSGADDIPVGPVEAASEAHDPPTPPEGPLPIALARPDGPMPLPPVAPPIPSPRTTCPGARW